MLKRESSAMAFSFPFFSFLMVFHLFVLASVAVNKKASTEEDIMSKIDGVLKQTTDQIGARGRFIIKINRLDILINVMQLTVHFLYK